MRCIDKGKNSFSCFVLSSWTVFLLELGSIQVMRPIVDLVRWSSWLTSLWSHLSNAFPIVSHMLSSLICSSANKFYFVGHIIQATNNSKWFRISIALTDKFWNVQCNSQALQSFIRDIPCRFRLAESKRLRGRSGTAAEQFVSIGICERFKCQSSIQSGSTLEMLFSPQVM